MSTGISQAVLYAFGPFFGNPIKPILNHLLGDGYEIAYTHFRRDHSSGPNIRMHLVCLFFQLLANFALMQELDSKLVAHQIPHEINGVAVNFSTTTAALWSLTLCFTPAPLICTLLSIGSIYAAMFTVSSFPTEMVWLEPVSIAIFLAVLFLSLGVTKATLGKLVFWVGWATGWHAVAIYGAGYLGSEHAVTYTVATTLFLLVLAGALANPVKPVVITGAVLLHVGAAVCNEPALLFWACAYSGMGLQGAAHDTSGQAATLLQLNDDPMASAKKIAFEWSHVTYFPNLLFHSCNQSLNSKKDL